VDAKELSTMNTIAQQRAALHVLELLARHPLTISHRWTESEIADVAAEVKLIENAFRRVAVEQDARACKSLGRETGRQVRMRRVKGVK